MLVTQLSSKMNSKTWDKIKSGVTKAHPLARIRKLHPIIQNRRISKKIRDEAKELANKARQELDEQHWWKSGITILPTRSSPQPELEELAVERPQRSLEDTVEAAAPTITKSGEDGLKIMYGAQSGEEYLNKGYFSKAKEDTYEHVFEAERAPDPASMATTSEIATGEVSYTRRKAKSDVNY